MQNDLISRSALIKKICKEFHIFDDWDGDIAEPLQTVIDIIDNTPTAYDVEKVVEKLCWESHMPTTEDEDSWILLDDAIKIVRNGGKE